MPYAEIEVHKHEEFDEQLRKGFPDGFLYFRYRVEVYAKGEESNSYIIGIASDILQSFWSRDIPAVAASDFEDMLPFNGGYKSRDVPWTKEEN